MVNYIYIQSILILGIGIGFVLGLSLFLHKKSNGNANKVLGLLLLFLSLSMSESLLVLSGGYRNFPHFISTTLPLSYLIGPLFYFHIKAKFWPEKFKVSKYTILHFIPAFLVVIDKLSFYMTEADLKISFIDNVLAQEVVVLSPWFFLLMLTRIIQNGLYIILAWKLITKYKDEFVSSYSNSSFINLAWVEGFSRWFSGYWILYLFVFLILGSFGQYSVHIDNFIFIGQTFFVLAIAFKVLREPQIYSTPTLYDGKDGKNGKNSLPKGLLQKYSTSLKKIMREEKPYLKSDLRLPELAEHLSISTNHLSQVLNQELGLNFFDFVNKYRVEDAKRKLINPDYEHSTILAIAYEAGFNNKASFNRIFKKATGLTPSQFIFKAKGNGKQGKM